MEEARGIHTSAMIFASIGLFTALRSFVSNASNKSSLDKQISQQLRTRTFKLHLTSLHNLRWKFVWPVFIKTTGLSGFKACQDRSYQVISQNKTTSNWGINPHNSYYIFFWKEYNCLRWGHPCQIMITPSNCTKFLPCKISPTVFLHSHHDLCIQSWTPPCQLCTTLYESLLW